MQASESSEWHAIVPSTDHVVKVKMVTNALKGEHGDYSTPQQSGTHGRKGWGRTHSSAHKGRYQDKKPTERVTINKMGRAQTQRVWSY